MFQSFVGFDFWGLFVTICNTIITFLILKHFLFKPVRKIIADRENEVQDLYAQAESDRVQAESMKNEYAATISGAKNEATEIVEAAKKRANVKAEEMLSEANGKANDLMRKAKESIEQERKSVMNEMKDEIADLSVMIASKVVEREVNADDHKRMIDDFIQKVG